MSLPPIPGNLVNTLLVVISIGGVVALNLIIAGLIVIAVLHDGDTATAVASTFTQILIDSVTAIGTLAGTLIAGNAVHQAMIAGQAQSQATTQTVAQVVKDSTP